VSVRAFSPRYGWRVCVLLVGAGLACTGYLLARVFVLLASSGLATHDLCSTLFGTGCDGALLDRRYWILGVPMAGWGLVYFVALGGLLALARFMRGTFETEAILAASLLALAGVGVGLALLASAVVEGSPVCPLCLSVHAISLLLLLALRRTSRQSIAEQLRLLRAASLWLIRPGTETPEPARWKLVGFASVALLAAVAYQWVYVESALRSPPPARPPDRAAVIAAHRGAPRLDIPVAQDDPHLGPLTSPVTLVVFESFRCPACRRFAPTLARIRDRFGDRLLIVYKHYPLSTTCNGRIGRDLQPGACEIAWAAEAARRQARFWPFYQALFAAGADASDAAVDEACRRLKLDRARFDADRRSDSTRARVAADIAAGDRLEIPGTPAVFLDGRLVSPASFEVLEILIRDALGAGSTKRGRTITDLGREVKHDRPSEGG